MHIGNDTAVAIPHLQLALVNHLLELNPWNGIYCNKCLPFSSEVISRGMDCSLINGEFRTKKEVLFIKK